MLDVTSILDGFEVSARDSEVRLLAFANGCDIHFGFGSVFRFVPFLFPFSVEAVFCCVCGFSAEGALEVCYAVFGSVVPSVALSAFRCVFVSVLFVLAVLV